MPKEYELIPIGTISEQTGIGASTLRYYESMTMLTSVRGKGGRRHYPTYTILRLELISTLRELGHSIEEIRYELEDYPSHRPPTVNEWHQAAAKCARSCGSRLDELKELRQVIDYLA